MPKTKIDELISRLSSAFDQSFNKEFVANFKLEEVVGGENSETLDVSTPPNGATRIAQKMVFSQKVFPQQYRVKLGDAGPLLTESGTELLTEAGEVLTTE